MGIVQLKNIFIENMTFKNITELNREFRINYNGLINALPKLWTKTLNRFF